jgi:hypothetical protein
MRPPTFAVYLHPDIPVYQSPEKAAKTLGIGRDTLIDCMLRRRDPLPHAVVGKGREYTTRKVFIPGAIEWIATHL